MFSNIEEPYDKLPNDLNSATSKLFYCFSRDAKNGRNTKIEKISHFFWFLNLHNLLERACNHIKLWIFWKCTWKCFWKWHIQLLQDTWNFLYELKTGQNENATRNLHPRNPCATIWIFYKPNSTSSLRPWKLWVVGKWNCPWTMQPKSSSR